MLKAGGSHKQSRLLQLREEYQQRMLKEKEDKIIHMYEESQRRAHDRAERVTKGHSANAYPNSRLQQPGLIQQQYQQQQQQQMQQQQMQQMQHGQPEPTQSSVRDFFRERREMEAKGGFVPPIEQHFKRARNSLRGNSGRKGSAGVDRSQPLAPIQQRHSAPADTPFGSSKPRLVKPRGNLRDDNNNETDKTADVSGNPQPSIVDPRSRSAVKKASPTPSGGVGGGVGTSKRSSGAREEKLSDFQKWQLQQAKAREERLKKLNTRVPQSGRDSEGFSHRVQEEGEEEEEDDIARKERELVEKISRQQAELDLLKKERELEEEQERQETERQRRQEAVERERRRRRERQEEARRKREEEEEAQAKHENEFEEEEESQRAVRTGTRSHAPRDRNSKQQDFRPSAGVGDSARGAPEAPRKPAPFQTRPPPQAQRGEQPSRPDASSERHESPVPGPDVSFYVQKALEDDASGERVKLVACRLCGRKFAEDRVQKHLDACKVSQKKRKVFDPVQMRTDGTEMAKYVNRGDHKKETPKKKNWRREHESFLESVRYAKKVTKLEQQGVSAKDLPPPPVSHNPDLVPCPHCGRTFNETAASRHIPRCKDLKTKPAPMRR
ncbi:zinc finger C2HC domain-containing protein 1C-like [Pomacea canaliculata]|uniref:zinc finger C2HC domain-containing protein 1C-like n=1 Tax=Pomacea canaliculata TaxID=400727 RepID=UPI000D726760|nr:zinc finger C2HC domain-containing protein 1C-like [Pomacea canaliculata]